MGFGPVLIYGAGLCGLAIAQGLQQSNIRFHIFEPLGETELECDPERNIAVGNLTTLRQLLPEVLADQLETEAAVHACGNHDQRRNATNVFDGKSGQLIAQVQKKDKGLVIDKARLRSIFAQDIDVKYRHVLDNIEYTDDGNVYAVFRNGERIWGSLVIGADGPRSIVRQMIYGAEKATLKASGAEYINLRLTYPPDVAHLIRTATSTSSNVGVTQDCVIFTSLLEMPDPDHPETWRFDVFVSWKKNKKNRDLALQEAHRVLKEKAANLSEPFRSALLKISSNTFLTVQDVLSWTPTPFHSRGGRITLAGNALHCLPATPGNSQSLDNALADARSFVQVIKKIVIGDAIKSHAIPAYGHEIVARAVRQEAGLGKDTVQVAVDHAVLSKNEFSPQMLARALNGANTPETLSESSTLVSESGRSSASGSEKSSKGRRALSRTSTWFRNQIDNLDVGAQSGTAQTTWAQVGQRSYGKRNFPDRDLRQYRSR